MHPHNRTITEALNSSLISLTRSAAHLAIAIITTHKPSTHICKDSSLLPLAFQWKVGKL